MANGAVGVEGFDALLDRTRRAVDAVVAAGSGDRPSGQITGEGTAADGLVRVKVTPRRVESLSVDARAMRLGAQALAAEIQSAVNQALDAVWRGAAGGNPIGDARAVAGSLAGQLRQLQDDSMRSMAMFTGALADVVAEMNRDRG